MVGVQVDMVPVGAVDSSAIQGSRADSRVVLNAAMFVFSVFCFRENADPR